MANLFIPAVRGKCVFPVAWSTRLRTVQHFHSGTNVNIKMREIEAKSLQTISFSNSSILQATYGAEPLLSTLPAATWPRNSSLGCSAPFFARLTVSKRSRIIAVSVGRILATPLLFIIPLCSVLTLTRVRRHDPIRCSRYVSRFYVTFHREGWPSCIHTPQYAQSCEETIVICLQARPRRPGCQC